MQLNEYLSPALVALIALLGVAVNYGAFSWRIKNLEKRTDGLEEREWKRHSAPISSFSQHD